MPPDSEFIEQEGVLIDNFKLVDGADGLLREAEARALLTGARYPARNPDQNMADLRAQVAANQKGVDELRKMVAHFGLDVVRAYMGHVQDNAEEAVRRVITALKDGQLLPGARQRRADPGGDPGRPGRAQRGDRLHRHLGAAGQQLQRAVGGVHGGGAVRVPHAGRRRDSAQCRLPQAAAGDHPGRLDAQSALSGVGRVGQCRDLDLHHQRAVRRARRDGGGAGDDEQLHVRQCALPVLRDHFGRLGRGRRLRRHRRGADQHDQFAPDRSGDPRIALPGAAGELRDPARLGRGGALAWRQWRHPQGALPGADDGGDPVEQPHLSAVRHGRRQSGRARAATGSSAPTAASSSWRTSARSRWAPGDVFVIETPGGGGYG